MNNILSLIETRGDQMTHQHGSGVGSGVLVLSEEARMTCGEELRNALSRVALTYHGFELARMDFQRALLTAARAGASERNLREVIHGYVPDLAFQLQDAEELLPIPDGFSGAGPYEICQRYATGQITRDQLVDELVRWDYPPRARTTDILDDILVDPPGAWSEVELAHFNHLIDLDLYGEVQDRRHRGGPRNDGSVEEGINDH